MRGIKNRNLAQLLMQLRFAPRQQRAKQLDSAEKLMAIIDAEQEYPFEFVCFHITGFRPKEPVDGEPVKGDELAADLGIFISQLSGQIATQAGEQGQRVFTINGLADAFGVSTKTIGRWRKRGLVARKFVSDDGKKRLGFLQSTVDSFVEKNPKLVIKAKNFKRLTDEEKQQAIAASQQPPQPDPATLLAQAEQGKAEAQQQKVLVEAQAVQREQDRKDFEATLSQQQQQFDNQMTVFNSAIDQLNTQAETLKLIREAMGVDTFTGPGTTAAFIQQSRKVIEAQQDGT